MVITSPIEFRLMRAKARLDRAERALFELLVAVQSNFERDKELLAVELEYDEAWRAYYLTPTDIYGSPGNEYLEKRAVRKAEELAARKAELKARARAPDKFGTELSEGWFVAKDEVWKAFDQAGEALEMAVKKGGREEREAAWQKRQEAFDEMMSARQEEREAFATALWREEVLLQFLHSFLQHYQAEEGDNLPPDPALPRTPKIIYWRGGAAEYSDRSWCTHGAKKLLQRRVGKSPASFRWYSGQSSPLAEGR